MVFLNVSCWQQTHNFFVVRNEEPVILERISKILTMTRRRGFQQLKHSTFVQSFSKTKDRNKDEADRHT